MGKGKGVINKFEGDPIIGTGIISVGDVLDLVENNSRTPQLDLHGIMPIFSETSENNILYTIRDFLNESAKSGNAYVRVVFGEGKGKMRKYAEDALNNLAEEGLISGFKESYRTASFSVALNGNGAV